MTDDLTFPRAAMRHDVWAARLSAVWDVGVIVLGADQEISFADPKARGLLAAASDAELEHRWTDVRARLRHALQNAGGETATEMILAFDRGSEGRDLHVQIYGIDEDDCTGHLILLQQAERAASMSAALRHATQDRGLSSLSRHVAHDLKGLLNVITMNVEILTRIANEAATATGQGALEAKCATVARRELGRLDRSLEVLLNREAIEQPDPRRFDIRQTCQNLTELIAPRAARQNVKVSLHKPDAPVDVVGFADRIHGALLNLIINALDAMPNGGTLVVDVSSTDRVRVAICDSGAGIDAGAAASMWGLYFSTKPGGTGIGLYVSKAVAEAHGGHISYHANPPGGACFVVELPAAPR